jgi:hypothetical protein
VIDSILLWIFVKISARWFGSVIFATHPETQRTTSIFFFDNEDHAHRFMEIIQKEKLNHELKGEEIK